MDANGRLTRKVSRQMSLFHPYSRRLHLMLLLMFGFFCASYMRSNLGMTMTCIVNATAVTIEAARTHEGSSTASLSHVFNESSVPMECRREGVETEEGVIVNDYGGTLVWSQTIQNHLFAGTFWGSLITVLPAGYLADRTSAMNLFQASILTYVVCTMLFPVLATHTPFYIVFVSRFIMGLGEALVVPAANALITRWIPHQEKSTAAAIFTLGNQVAGSFGVTIAAVFCASSFRWPAVFYFCGFLGIVWSVLWRLVVTNAPEKAKLMTKDERAFLEENLEKVHRGEAKKQQQIPWIKIFTSIEVLACFVSISSVNMVVVLLQSYQPSFMKEVLYLKLVDNGLYSAAPFLVQIVTKLTWSITIDHLKATKRVSNTFACKFSQGFSSFVMGFFLFLIPYFVDCTRPEIVVFMFCAVGMGFSTAISGFYTSMLSLAPAYVGTISSLAQFVGICGMLVPQFLISHFRIYGTLAEWQIIFSIIAIYTILSGLFFIIFGKGETLEWGRGSHVEEGTHLQKIEVSLEQ